MEFSERNEYTSNEDDSRRTLEFSRIFSDAVYNKKPISSLELKLKAREVLGANVSVTQASASAFLKRMWADGHFPGGYIATMKNTDAGAMYFRYIVMEDLI